MLLHYNISFVRRVAVQRYRANHEPAAGAFEANQMQKCLDEYGFPSTPSEPKATMDKPISSIMQKIVNPAAMDDTVDDVEQILNSHDFSCVPVIADNGAVVGILTSRDLLHFHATGKDPKTIHAWEICHYKPIEVSPDTPIREVAELMLNNRIHHIVVTQDGSMKGVVSSLDFVRLLVSQSSQ